MTVADLQKVLKWVAETCAAGGGAEGAGELLSVSKALQPLADRDLTGLVRFLTTAKEPGDGPLLALTKSLYDRATDPSVTREDVERQIKAFGKVAKGEIEAAVVGVGLKQKPKSKAEGLEALIRHVMGRKGSAVRAEV